MAEPLVHLQGVLAEPGEPTCRQPLGDGERVGGEREGTCPECLDIRDGKGMRMYVGGRRVPLPYDKRKPTPRPHEPEPETSGEA